MAEDVTGQEETPLAEGEAKEEMAEAPEPKPAPQREVARPRPAPPPKPEARPKAEGAGPDLDFVLDLPLEVSVELGRASMLVGELLQLGQGSVVELNKLAGEPLEILVNSKLIARGEAVVINEKFGVRITDVVPADERVRRLG